MMKPLCVAVITQPHNLRSHREAYSIMNNRVNQDVRALRNAQIPELYSEKNVPDDLKHLSVTELQQITSNRTFPFRVMLLNVMGDMNVSTVIRSAHLMGAESCVVFGRRKIDNRGLVGAANYTPVEKIWAVNEDLTLQTDAFVQYCAQHAVMPVFVEQGGHNVFEYDWQQLHITCTQLNRKIMLVLGTERDGIPPEILEAGARLGPVVSIPQRGVLRSHNLSMAFAIVASQMISQLRWY
jgi:tRNA G18 (ribose-2'-O)-methylase SpoU